MKITLATLKEATRDHNIPIILYNTCPAKEGNDLSIISEIPNLEIKNITCKSIDTIIPKVITDAFNIAEDDYIILLDSDTIVHPKAIDKFLQIMEQQAEEGVDFMTIHAGLRRFHLQFLPLGLL